MTEYKRLGIYLDESPADDDVLHYAARIATLAKSETIHCVYCRLHDEHHPSARPDPEAFVREQLPAELHGRLKITIEQHHGMRTMLNACKAEDIDLLLVGRRLPSDQIGVGAVYSRLARKAPCSVFVVPDGGRIHLARVLVPVDFSEHSKLALETALQFARASTEKSPQVVVQTIYCVGYGYHKAGVSLEEASQRMEQATLKKLDEFLAGVDTSGVEFSKVCTCSEEIAAAINETAAVQHMDLVCIGSRGATSDMVSLIGGTAEHVIAAIPKPVLVVKRKGETLSILEALLAQMG